MDQEWRRFHLLLVFMTTWSHAIGYPSLNSQVNPRSLRYHKAFSPQGFKSLSGASMTRNIPLGVNSNVLAVKSPSSSPFSQFGSASGTYESVSQTHSSPSGSVSASLALPQNLHQSTLLQLQGSSSSNVQGMASQSAGGPGTYSQYIAFKDRTGLQAGGSSQLVSAQGGSASLSGLSSQSPSTFSQYSPVSSAYPSLGSLSMPVSGTSSFKTSQFSFNAGSRGGSSQLATSSLSGLAQGVSSHPVGSYVQSQSSPSQLAFGSSQYGSASTAAAHTTSSPYNPANAQSLSQSQIPQGWRPSAAQSMFSAASVPAPSKFVSSLGRPSQFSAASLYSSASLVSPQVASGQNSKTAADVLSLSSQTSQRLQPLPSSSQGVQGSGAALSRSRFSVPSASDPRKSLASGGHFGQSAPSLYSSASMPSPQSGSMHSQAAGSAHSLSQSPAPQRWQPSASLSSQGFQTSSSGVSQSSSPSQGAKFPSRFSMSSGSGPSQLVSTQGASSYGGLVQSLSSYAPGYSKPAFSPLGVPSQFTSGQSQYASSSRSMAGGLVSASSRYPSAQTGGGSNIASLHPQVAAGQYAPAPSLDVKVPVYSHPTSSGSSMSSNLQSQTWQPTTSRRVYNKFPTSGAALDTFRGKAVPHQSSSRFPSVAGGTSRLLTQSGGSYIGSSQSLGSDGQYTPGSPAYAKFGASSLGVSSQSTSGQSSSSQYLPLSTTGAGGQLTSSGGYLSAQGESVSSVGSSLLSQGASSKEVLAPMDTSMSVASQTAPVSSGIQASGAAAFQSGSSASSNLSSLQALSSPVDSVTQSASASSQVLPFGSMTQSSGSSVQAASNVSAASSQAQTLSESAGSGARVESQGMSGGSTPVLSGSYESSFGQSAPISNPSHGYYGVKG